jgi:hypothetical protein
MFAKTLTKSLQVLIGAAVASVIVTTSPVHAEESTVVRDASVMNQSNGVYETTLKFYLHPARLEVTETPREKMDHPAVILARRPKADFDWTSAFILHPARLAVASDEGQTPAMQPAVRIARSK